MFKLDVFINRIIQIITNDIRNKIHVHFVSYVLTYNHANIGPIMVTEIEV